ncbi:MAG TPA: SAF domain-containing protein [Trichormus sp.]
MSAVCLVILGWKYTMRSPKVAPEMWTVVHTNKDIPESAQISYVWLEERETLASECPRDAFARCEECAGLVAKTNLSAGQVICRHNVFSASVPQGKSRP